MAFPQVGVEAVMSMADFKSGMDLYNSSIDEMISSSQRAAAEAGGAMDSFFSRATEGAMEGAVVFGGLGATITALATKAVFSAARLEELDVVLALVSQSAGYTQEAVDGMIASLQDQGIAATAAREGVLRVMQAQLDLGAALELAKVAQDLAIVGQQESTATFQDFIKATVTGNTIILRKYGIMSTGIMMYKVYAEKIGIATKDLTQQQKQEAIMQGILAAGITVQGAYNEAMTTVSKNFRSLPRLIEDVVNAFGKGFLPIFKEAIFTVKDILKTLGALDAQTWETISQIAGLVAVMSTAVGAAGGLVFVLPKIAAALAFLTGPLGLVAVAVGALTYAFITDFGGVRDKVLEVVDAIIPKLQQVAQFVGDNWIPVLAALATMITVTVIPSLVTLATVAFDAAVAMIATIAPLVAAAAPIIALGVAVGLLTKYFEDMRQAAKDLNLETIETSETYAEYIVKMEDSAKWTTILSEEVWELTKAEMALAGEADKTAIAVQSVAQQRILNELSQLLGEIELGAEIYGEFAEEARIGTNAQLELTKQIALGSETMREAAVAQGLLSREAADVAASAEASDRAMLSYAKATQELRVQTDFYTKGLAGLEKAQDGVTQSSLDAIKAAGGVGGVMAEVAMKVEAAGGKIKASFDDLMDKERDMARAPEIEFWRAKFEDAMAAVGKSFQGLGNTISSGYDQLLTATTNYQQQALQTATQFTRQLEQTAQQNALSRLQSEEQYRLRQTEMIAQYEAEAAALAAAGQDEKLFDLTRSHEQSLAEAQYAYDKQIAQQGQAETIQLHMAQVSNAQRVYDAAISHHGELVELQKHVGNKIMMWVSMNKMELDLMGGNADDLLKKVGELFGSELTLADQFNIEWKKFLEDWAAGNIDAADIAGQGWQAFADILRGETDKAAATTQAAKDRLDEIAAGWAPPTLDVPEMPDWGQWADDYAGGASTAISSAGGKMAESSTRVLKEVVEDISTAFEKAMKVFGEVAGYVTPTGLGVAMEALRKDIQEAVRQLYIAYEAIGKDGVVGAGLIAEAASKVVTTLGAAAGIFSKLGEYTSPLRGSIDALIADVKYVLVKVRTELLDLWGWAGARKDTVWGHMMDWADAVSGVLDIVAQAVVAFTALKDYTSPLKASVDAFVADLQTIMDALMGIEFGEVDEAQVAWMEFAAALLAVVTGIIGDMEELAAFEGGLTISAANVTNLVTAMQDGANAILAAIGTITSDFQDEDSVDQLKAAWLDFSAGLVSTLAGMVDDLQKLLAFSGGLSVSWTGLWNLISSLDEFVGVALGYIGLVVNDLTISEVDELKVAWLEFSSGLLSAMAGIVDDLEEVLAFEGGLTVSWTGLWNLVSALDEFVGVTLGFIGLVVDDLAISEVDQLKVAWLDFASGLVSALTGVVEDLQTLAAFEGGLVIAQSNVENLVSALGDVASWILGAVDTVTSDFNLAEGSVDMLKAAWLDFSAGLISTVSGAIEDMAALAALEGDFGYNAIAVENLVRAIDYVATDILTAVGTVVSDFNAAEDSVDALNAAWLGFAAGLISTVSGAVEDMAALAALEDDFGYDSIAVGNLVRAIDYVATDILTAIGVIISDFNAAEDSVDALKAAWLDFSVGLISTVSGAIEDMAVLAAFEGGLVVGQSDVENLINTLEDVAGWILGAIDTTTSDFNAAEDSVDQLNAEWLEFSAGLVSTIAGVIDDLAALAAFEGSLSIIPDNIANLVAALGDAVDAILLELGDLEEFDEDAMAAAQLFAETAGAVLDALGAGMEVFAQEMPEIGEGVEEGIAEFARLLGVAVEKFKAEALAFDTDALAATKDFAETAGAVLDALGMGMEVFANEMPALAEGLADDIERFAEALGWAVEDFAGEAEAFDADALAAAKDFAETAGAVVAVIGAGIEGFALLPGFVSPGQQAMQGFAQAIGYLVEQFRVVAGVFIDDALADAQAFADAAGAVVSIVAEGVEALPLLATFIAPGRQAVEAFAKAVADLVEEFRLVAVDFDADMLADAAAFADAAGSVVGLVKGAVEAFDILKDYSGIPYAAIKKLARDIGKAIKELVALEKKFDKDAVKAAKEFSEDAKAIFEFIKDAVGALDDLREYEDVVSSRFGRLKLDIEDAVQMMADTAELIDADMLADARNFSEAVSEVLGYIQDAMGVLAAIGEYSGIGQTWRDFRDDIEESLGQLTTITGIVEAGETDAADFLAAMENVMGDVQDGLDILTGLTYLAPDWPTSELQAALNELAGMGAAAVSEFASNISEAVSDYVKPAWNNLFNMIINGVQGVNSLLASPGPHPFYAFIDLGYGRVCEFADGINRATLDCVAPAFDNLALVVAAGVAAVNIELDNLGVSSPKFQSLHELNDELMQTAAIAAATLQTIAAASEPQATVPLGMGGGTVYNQTFNPSVTLGGPFYINEEADIGHVTEAVLEAMREGLGDITSRRERY